jgi:hypothetical protein
MEKRSLAPREHGAYGQLGFPLLTGLLVGHPTAPALLLTAAAIAAFLVHEPALVAFGRRGQRVKENDGRRALGFFAAAVAASLALGATGLWLASPQARAGALIATALGAMLGGTVLLGVEKTLPGELIAAAAMTSAGFMVALAAGAPWPLAAAMWGTWLLAFASAVFPVRAVIVEHKKRAETVIARVVPTLVVIIAAIALAAERELPPHILASAAPLMALSLTVAIKPPTMKEMTRAGWLLMVAGAVTTVWMVLAVRLYV